jgi:hypothetical protein
MRAKSLEARAGNGSLRPAATYHYDSKVHPKLKFSLKFIMPVALLVSLTCTIAAQQQAAAIQTPSNQNAYRLGERLTYNVDFSHFVSAAHVEMLVAGRGAYFNRDGIKLRAHVETVGIVNVALLSINNDYTTYVDPQTGLPYRGQQVVRQSGQTAEAALDYNQPAGTEAISVGQSAGEFIGSYDLLSALYRIRAMPLADGASYFLAAQHDGGLSNAEVKVVGRQMLKTNLGSFNTIITRVIVKNGQDYNLRIYFTDDNRHVPIRILAKHPAGEIRADLTGSELTVPEVAPKSSSIQPLKTGPQDPPISTRPGPPVTVQLPPGNTPQIPLRDVPFKIGEQLIYQVFLGSTAQSAGTITFTVKARGQYFNKDGLLFSALAQTNGVGGRIFAVNDRIDSYVDPATLLPFRSELNLAEGKYRISRNYNLDQNRGSATPEKGPKVDIPVGTHDLISALYAIRTFDLALTKRNAISLMATSQPRTLFIEAQRRETIELGGQKIDAMMITLTTDDQPADRMQIRIWIGDDARRLPLRIAALTQLGAVHADLVIVPINSQ